VLSILDSFQSLEYLSRLPSAEQELLVAIKAACDSALKPLIVVLTSGGGLAIDTTQADAIIQAWYCGPQGGTALAEILAGDVNPSAKLPDYVLRLG
jgi:beta-glucosidase